MAVCDHLETKGFGRVVARRAPSSGPELIASSEGFHRQEFPRSDRSICGCTDRDL